MFNNGLSPGSHRSGDAPEPSLDHLIRQPDSLFLKYGRRSYEPVNKDDLRRYPCVMVS